LVNPLGWRLIWTPELQPRKSIINNLLYHLGPWLMLRKSWSGLIM